MSSTPVSPEPEPPVGSELPLDGDLHVGSEPHAHVSPRPGESAPFHFTSHWQIERPAVQVWEVFQDIAQWPDWWPGVREVTVLDSGGSGVSDKTGAGTGVSDFAGVGASDGADAANGEGTRAVLRVRRPVLPDLRVDLAVTRTDPPHRALVEISGHLRGHGHWRAVDETSVCRVEFVWCVVTQSPLTRILRGAAGWAHRRVMNAGEAGLQEQLDSADR